MKNFLLFSLTNILILGVFLFNLVLFYHFKDYESTMSESSFYGMFGLIMIIESLIIMFIIKLTYENPILELEMNIKKFLVGSLKDKDIKFKKTLNPHLNYTLNFFEKTLSTLKNIKNEFLTGKAIKGEVGLAKEIQDKLLNKKQQKIPSLEIVAKSRSAAEIGGDSYDIIKQEDNYYIYVGDVTGHGVASGFVMVMVNALISGFSKVYRSGAQILGHTNEILKPRIKSNILMTLLMVRWDEKNKRLFMSGAGHEYLMIYKHKLNKCFKVKSGGIALGMTKNIHKILKEQEIKFEEDDVIILYTDGITEAKTNIGRGDEEMMYGEDRLVKSIETSPDIICNGRKIKTARTIFNNITIKLSEFMGYKCKQLDDITLVTIHYVGDKVIKNDINADIPDEFITEWSWK